MLLEPWAELSAADPHLPLFKLERRLATSAGGHARGRAEAPAARTRERTAWREPGLGREGQRGQRDALSPHLGAPSSPFLPKPGQVPVSPQLHTGGSENKAEVRQCSNQRGNSGSIKILAPVRMEAEGCATTYKELNHPQADSQPLRELPC